MRPTARLSVATLAAAAAAAALVATATAGTTAGATASAAVVPSAINGSNATSPTIFGHRGAAGYRPEHTAASYDIAAKMGADYLEPDLVPTKDGYLVDRHEPEISQTTNVADHPEFAKLKTTKVIDGVKTTGWFTTDFTLKQLETLRAKERIPDIRQHNTIYNNMYRIPTLQDDIKQFEALSTKLHRRIGIVPEIKHSTFFRSIGLPMEDRVLSALHAAGLDRKNPKLPVVIQSFEVGNLQYLHAHSSYKLMQLTAATGAPADFVASGDPRTYADVTSAAGLKEVATYATYLGPDKNEIVPRTSTNALGTPTTLVADSHAAGLLVAPYTFRNENSFLPTDFQSDANPADYGNVIAEYELFFALGVDGMFSDNSDTAVIARKDWIRKGRPHTT